MSQVARETAVFKWSSAIGPLSVVWPLGANRLTAIRLPNEWPPVTPAPTLVDPPPAWVRQVVAAIDAELAGQPPRALPAALDLAALTPFRRRVSDYVRSIPRGETRTYQQVAAAIGSPAAARAVGQVMARNPFPLLIPCHRVTAAHGLGGFGGGLPLKEQLLARERG